MAVYTVVKQYRTKGHMGMMDVTEDFRSAVRKACQEKQISDGIVTGFTWCTTSTIRPGVTTMDPAISSPRSFPRSSPFRS